MNMNTSVKVRSKKSIVRLCSRPSIFLEESLIELERYARGESWLKDIAGEKFVFGVAYAASAVEHCAQHYLNSAVVAILSSDPGWREPWERSVLYGYWTAILHMVSFDAYERANPAVDWKNHAGRLDFSKPGFNLGNCLALGWLEEAKTLAGRMNFALDRGWFYDGGCGTFKRRTQHFVLRLVADWQGWPERTELPCIYDVPVFNDLIEQWRTPNVQWLSTLLSQALDRHSEQTQNDTEDDRDVVYYDCNDADQMYNPMEVLAVLRLRETLGLPNPEMPKHQVTDTPLGRALPPASTFPKDDLLDRVLARVRREYPDLLTA